MKTIKGILLTGLLIGIVAVPAFAMMEEISTVTAPQTLADFQRIYSGTKSVVAVHKYQEAKLLKEYPRPTLEISRMRMDRPPVAGQGTKGHVVPAQAVYTTPWVQPIPGSGTKPVVQSLIRR